MTEMLWSDPGTALRPSYAMSRTHAAYHPAPGTDLTYRPTPSWLTWRIALRVLTKKTQQS
eukprot:1166279-Rhodomonas_salina.1